MPVYTNNTSNTITERVENEDGVKSTIKIDLGLNLHSQSV